MNKCCVSNLSPLAACSLLAEQLADNHQVISLTPLNACSQLCKIDLNYCNVEVFSQLEDLQLGCPLQMEDSWVEGLVMSLRPNIPEHLRANLLVT
jgi:hypothetical protein